MAETNLLKRGIPTLPPGKPVEALFDQLPARLQQGLPDDYDVTISYEDPLGNNYSEQMTVGYSHLREVGRLHRRDIHDVHKELHDIAREIQKWTYMGQALRVMTRADVKEEIEQLEERYERKQAEAEAEAEARVGEVEQLGPTGFEPPPDPEPGSATSGS